jgi:hypothetical protein
LLAERVEAPILAAAGGMLDTSTGNLGGCWAAIAAGHAGASN